MNKNTCTVFTVHGTIALDCNHSFFNSFNLFYLTVCCYQHFLVVERRNVRERDNVYCEKLKLAGSTDNLYFNLDNESCIRIQVYEM